MKKLFLAVMYMCLVLPSVLFAAPDVVERIPSNSEIHTKGIFVKFSTDMNDVNYPVGTIHGKLLSYRIDPNGTDTSFRVRFYNAITHGSIGPNSSTKRYELKTVQCTSADDFTNGIFEPNDPNSYVIGPVYIGINEANDATPRLDELPIWLFFEED